MLNGKLVSISSPDLLNGFCILMKIGTGYLKLEQI